jgi:uncharacterized protein YbaP (TraB family)
MGFESGLLWQLNFKKTQSYLFGTIHLNSPLFTDHRRLFDSLLSKCRVFAAEVDLDRIDPAEMQSFFNLPGQTDWKSSLKPNQWNKLKDICEKRFLLDLNHYTKVYPMILVNQLSLQLIERNIEKSIDQSLWELAKENNLSTTGLENFEDHFHLISEIEINDQVKMIKQFLLNLNKSRKMYTKMLTDYHNQDLRAIYKTSRKMLGKYRRMMLLMHFLLVAPDTFMVSREFCQY